ncbi:MAG: PilZ domain-containing protein [Cellvibrionaceae bacterium]
MGLLDREYSEKRNFIRMKVNTPVEIAINQENRTINGICHDLSGGGMLLTLDEALALDTELMVTVNSAHGHNPMLQASCVVSRVEAGPKNSHLLGLEIQEVLNHPELEAVEND